MPALSITSPAPSERRLTGGVLFLLAGLAALGALATNIILPAVPRIGAGLGVSSQELGLTLSSFFVAFAFGQLLVGPLSDRFGRKLLVLRGCPGEMEACLGNGPPAHSHDHRFRHRRISATT